MRIERPRACEGVERTVGNVHPASISGDYGQEPVTAGVAKSKPHH